MSPALCVCARSVTEYLGLPLSLTAGPPACFTVSRKWVKLVLSFPAFQVEKIDSAVTLVQICPHAGVENKQRSCMIGPAGPRDCLNRVQDEK